MGRTDHMGESVMSMHTSHSDEKQAAKILLETKSVLINTEEPFHYTSGKIGPVYVDCRRLMSFPQARSTLMDMAANLLKPLGFEYIAGGETAGIPYAAFIAERLGLPMLYVRKKPKGHGRMAQIEGHIEGKNRTILLVEDLMNVGSSQQIFIDALRQAEMSITHSFVIFSYGIYPETTKHFESIGVTPLSLTCWWAILQVMKDEGLYDSKTIQSFEEFLNAPSAWEDNFQKKNGSKE